MKYILMHRTLPVAIIYINDNSGTIYKVEKIIAPSHLPVGVQGNKLKALAESLNGWFSGRAIPASRAGFQQAMQAFAMEHNIALTPTKLLLHCYGLSLSDQYWVNPIDLPLDWEKINFFDHSFSDDVGNILFGNIPNSKKIDLLSPCNASDGWLRKKWKILNGKRVLVKGGSGVYCQEPFNEVVAASLCDRLSIPHVSYRLVWEDGQPYSVCPDMVNNHQDFVNAYSIYYTLPPSAEQTPYQHFLHCCDTLGIAGAKQRVAQMLVLDFLIANTDRHMGNFGAIRDAITLEWNGIAPVFDSGSSMWHEVVTGRIAALSDSPAKPFCSTQFQQLALVSDDIGWVDFTALRGIGDFCREVYASADFGDEPRANILATALEQRCEALQQFSRGLQWPAKLNPKPINQICADAKAKAAEINAEKTIVARQPEREHE